MKQMKWPAKAGLWLAPVVLGGAAVALTHSVGAQGGTTAAPAASKAAEAQLDAGVPQPEKVFIQQTSAFPGRGNVLISVQLSEADLSEKLAEGTAEFITIGDEGSEVILRDDGRGGDEVAGDGLFTGPAFVDRAELAERKTEDEDALSRSGSTTTLVFAGRAVGGEETVQPFDLAGFDAGQRVELDPAIIAFDESISTTSGTGKSAARTLTPEGTIAPVTAPRNCSSTPGPSPGATNLFQDRVLMIRDVAVVEDPTRTVNPCDGTGSPFGAWTFAHLMTEMANQDASGIDPSDFVEQWLETWAQSPAPLVNNHLVSRRSAINNILDGWRAESGGGKLDLAKAPFRLMAIVPRFDLRTTEGGGGGYGGRSTGKFLDGGELRFVFGVVLRNGWSTTGMVTGPEIDNNKCLSLPFTVILEYKVPRCDCPEVRDWARSWEQLAQYAPTSSTYRAKLERLTESVVRANADPRKPNGSAIGQVRTNEVALRQDSPALPANFDQFVWELREFQLTQNPFGFLEETTTADTPQDRFNDESHQFTGSPLLADWIQGKVEPALAGANDCAADIPPVPLLFQGSLPSSDNFLGANPQVPEDDPAVITYHWDHPNLTYSYPFENWARHRVSLAACSGCHRRETQTPFLQVDPQVPFGSQAVISGFLQGINDVTDPADPGSFPRRSFDDLLRRERDVKALARIRCARFHPVAFDHVKQTLAATGSLPDDLFQGLPVLPEELLVSTSPDAMRVPPVSEVH